MRTAIYVRVSTENQENNNQILQLREFASKQGWNIVVEYIDVGSGGNSDRKRFKDMLRDAQHRKFEVLLFWSLDRLSREGALKTLGYLQALSDRGICYKSYTEGYLDSCGPFGEGVVALLACVAKQERIRLSERTRAGIARAAAQGKRLGRPPAVLDLERIREMRRVGLTMRAISAALSVPASTVAKKLKEAGGTTLQPSVTTVREEAKHEQAQ